VFLLPAVAAVVHLTAVPTDQEVATAAQPPAKMDCTAEALEILPTLDAVVRKMRAAQLVETGVALKPAPWVWAVTAIFMAAAAAVVIMAVAALATAAVAAALIMPTLTFVPTSLIPAAPVKVMVPLSLITQPLSVPVLGFLFS